ncbi:TPA: minor capsid protein [Bacillus mycoides]|nr:minor capsid protein [Bacillus mycoides]
MIWLVESVKKHLIATLPQGILFAPIKADLLDIGVNDTPRKSIAVRMIPSPPGEQYYEGEIIKKQIQILAKSSNQLEVNNTIEFITRELNNVHRRVFYAIDGSYTLRSLNVYVEPNFVDKTAANEWVYTALFITELEIGG